jgi:hypothetical protein
MNPLPEPVIDACLEVLYRGLVHIRLASLGGDTARAEAIADALHNLPHLLSDGHRRGWTVEEFRSLFIAELVSKYPDLAALDETLKGVE